MKSVYFISKQNKNTLPWIWSANFKRSRSVLGLGAGVPRNFVHWRYSSGMWTSVLAFKAGLPFCVKNASSDSSMTAASSGCFDLESEPPPSETHFPWYFAFVPAAPAAPCLRMRRPGGTLRAMPKRTSPVPGSTAYT